MNIARSSAAGIAALMATSTGMAQSPSDWLIQAPLPELIVGYEAERGGSSIVEQIPPGETVQRWTKMVTTQRFGGAIAGGLTLRGWVGNFLARLQTGCPGYRASEPVRATVEGRSHVSFRVDCPLNPDTGQAETFLLRAFAGSTDLHVVQIAFRHVPSSSEIAWAQAHLATVHLCDRSSTMPACRSREPTPAAKSGASADQRARTSG